MWGRGPLLKNEERHQQNEQLTQREGEGAGSRAMVTAGPALCLALGSSEARLMGARKNDAEVARNLPGIPSRRHWGKGRPAGAMGECGMSGAEVGPREPGRGSAQPLTELQPSALKSHWTTGPSWDFGPGDGSE